MNELNLKLETERREDKRSLLQEKAARNINKLSAARRDRKGVRSRFFVFISGAAGRRGRFLKIFRHYMSDFVSNLYRAGIRYWQVEELGFSFVCGCSLGTVNGALDIVI